MNKKNIVYTLEPVPLARIGMRDFVEELRDHIERYAYAVDDEGVAANLDGCFFHVVASFVLLHLPNTSAIGTAKPTTNSWRKWGKRENIAKM